MRWMNSRINGYMVWIVFVIISSIIPFEGVFGEIPDTPDLLHQILSRELQDFRFIKWENTESIIYFAYRNESRRVLVHGPIEQDINHDGNTEVIVGFEFFDRQLSDIEDFFTVYGVEKNGQLKKYFSQRFELSDRGSFLDLQVTDITGNGLLDIGVTYMVAHAGGGANYWEAEDTFYLIRGHVPFDSLLELVIRKGKGGNQRDNPYFMETGLEFRDIDGDGLKEAITVRREGRDEFELQPVSSQPEMYRATFTLTSYTFASLRNKGLPEEILQGLQPLEEQEFATKGDFLHAVEQQIGEEHVRKYETLLIQYGISQYRLENDHE